MKKHKMEFMALTLLLGVLCYAFYDCNNIVYETEMIITNDLFSTTELTSKDKTEDSKKEENKVKEEVTTSKEEITKEMLSLSNNNNNNENKYKASLLNVDESIPYNEIVSNQVVNYALQFVGGPYVYGGNSLTKGTDCSGFTKLVFAKFGINLDRVASNQKYNGRSVGLNNIMPGDLVLSGYGGQIGHSSLYIGNNKLVHALNSNVGIVVTDLYIMPIIDVRRVI